MKYFHGFSLKNEKILFENYLPKSCYTVAGFSYGAQLAFEYVYASNTRIDRLILLSPAFFQTEKRSFIRTQLRYFEAGREAYVKQFLKNVTYPSSFALHKYLNIGTEKELNSLLSYVWDAKKFKEILNRGTKIEVFIGNEDKIIKSEDAISFFRDISTLYTIKKSGHLLLER